jgi:hypothetical protein
LRSSYWSSTTLSGSPSSAWNVNVGGIVSANGKSILYLVRAVRANS